MRRVVIVRRSVAPFRYRSADEDSARWTGFPFRAGDIVDQHPVQERHDVDADDLRAARLPDARPAGAAGGALARGWTGWSSREDVLFARLAAQDHRRFIKTHTPLDGVPLDPRATYIVVARHPARHGRLALPPGRQPRPGAHPRADGRPAPTEPPAAPAAAAGLAAGLDRPGRRPARGPGLAARRGLAPDRRVVPPARAERRAGALRRPVRRPRGRDAPAGRSPRLHRARGPWPELVRAATFDDMRAGRSSWPPTRPGS